MNLVQALRLVRIDTPIFEEPACLALVGAGGKTSALFQIGRQLPGPVVVTATTHLSIPQLKLADYHLSVRSPQDIAMLDPFPSGKIALVTGHQVEERRVSGIENAALDSLYTFAQERQIPLLIEADGSRQRPVKAPGDHEPAIPDFVRQVVVVAGLSALGKPLAEEWVHRPERFSVLSGIPLGHAITEDGLAKVLSSLEGGLKRIPTGARRIALLTQVDTAERRIAAGRLAGQLRSSYDAVLVASLQPVDSESPGEREGTDNLDFQPVPTVHSVYEPAAAILLAAGGSSRMGRPKQLLTWEGEPMVRYVASKALAAGLSPVIVVTGAYHELVSLAVAGLPIKLIENPEWESGQSSSVRAGMKCLPARTGSAVFLLVDQPQVPPELIRSLLALHARTLSPIVAPRVGGQRANPVLFDRLTFPDLMSIQGDVGGRPLFNRYPVAWLDWQDENLLLDIDTEEDYRRLPNEPLH